MIIDSCWGWLLKFIEINFSILNGRDKILFLYYKKIKQSSIRLEAIRKLLLLLESIIIVVRVKRLEKLLW